MDFYFFTIRLSPLGNGLSVVSISMLEDCLMNLCPPVKIGVLSVPFLKIS